MFRTTRASHRLPRPEPDARTRGASQDLPPRSGVAIECLAGDDVEKLAAPVQTPRPEAPREEDIT